jgi:hypothetical protein
MLSTLWDGSEKNFLFLGSGEADKHSAILYTIVASARPLSRLIFQRHLA